MFSGLIDDGTVTDVPGFHTFFEWSAWNGGLPFALVLPTLKQTSDRSGLFPTSRTFSQGIARTREKRTTIRWCALFDITGLRR